MPIVMLSYVIVRQASACRSLRPLQRMAADDQQCLLGTINLPETKKSASIFVQPMPLICEIYLGTHRCENAEQAVRYRHIRVFQSVSLCISLNTFLNISLCITLHITACKSPRACESPCESLQLNSSFHRVQWKAFNVSKYKLSNQLC